MVALNRSFYTTVGLRRTPSELFDRSYPYRSKEIGEFRATHPGNVGDTAHLQRVHAQSWPQVWGSQL
jgi:hypothetical protein